ncbi:uncharacterized protein LOC134249955 [Saccostrea cucullata]|uniref:uncharacterized protein LOC134249955 n=1 Tax=Saccostrea cuccullata TaxID=36930 RepID=UPI002ECFB6D8
MYCVYILRLVTVHCSSKVEKPLNPHRIYKKYTNTVAGVFVTRVSPPVAREDRCPRVGFNCSLILSELECRSDGNADSRKPRTSKSLSLEKRKIQKPLNSYSNVTENYLRSILVKNSEIRRKTFNIEFVEREPSVIGDDGGYDNLLLSEELPLDEDSWDDISSTEEEHECVLQALYNTIWNSDLNNLNGAQNKTTEDDKIYELEDAKLSSLWKKDRFSKLRDCDKLFSQRFGKFPLRRPLDSKSSLEQMFDRDGKLEISSPDCDLKKIEEKEGTYNVANFSIFKKRRSLSDPGITRYSSVASFGMEDHEHIETQPYMDENVTQFSGQSDKMKDREDDVFEMDKFDAEKSLFDNFYTEINFDSSSAGMALVDHLNAILARYSDGVSIKGFDNTENLQDSDLSYLPANSEKMLESLRISEGSIKSKELEAKIVSLAKDTMSQATVIRKKKRPAPRPPVTPPPQPTSRKGLSLKSNHSSKITSPSYSQNLSEPILIPVPKGKSTTGNTQQESQSPKRTDDFHDDLLDNRAKSDNSKGKTRITSFFRNILRRRKGSHDTSREQISETSSPQKVTAPINPAIPSTEKGKEPSPEPKEEKKSWQVKAKVLSAVSNRKSRTGIIMSATEKSARFHKPHGNKAEDTTESECVTSSMIVKENESKSESVPRLNPPVPIRPKPRLNAKRPTASPYQAKREGLSSSPSSERKGSLGCKERKRSDSESALGSLEKQDKGSLEREITRVLSKEDSLSKDIDSKVVRGKAKIPAPQTLVVPGTRVENKNALFKNELEMSLSKSLDSEVTLPPAGQKGNVASSSGCQNENVVLSTCGQIPNDDLKTSVPCPPTTTIKSEVAESITGGQTNQQSAVCTMDIRAVIKEFDNWFRSNYPHIQIVDIYMGKQTHHGWKDALVVIIDHLNVLDVPPFEYFGKKIDIYCKLWKQSSPESMLISKHIHVHGNNINHVKLSEIERCLKANSRSLLEHHSNLEIVSASAYHSRKNGNKIDFEPCIVIYCSCKGIVPYGEKEFPKQIDGIKTDMKTKRELSVDSSPSIQGKWDS